MDDDEYEAVEAMGRLARELENIRDGGALGATGSGDDLRVADILDDARRRIRKVVFG